MFICVCFFNESKYIEIAWKKLQNEYIQMCLGHVIPIESHLFEYMVGFTPAVGIIKYWWVFYSLFLPPNMPWEHRVLQNHNLFHLRTIARPSETNVCIRNKVLSQK